MTRRDILELGLKEDARTVRNNLPPGQVRSPEIPTGPGRSSEIPMARGDETQVVRPLGRAEADRGPDEE
jgi:hypothetical protein